MDEDPEVLILDKLISDNFPYILDDSMLPIPRGAVLEDVSFWAHRLHEAVHQGFGKVFSFAYLIVVVRLGVIDAFIIRLVFIYFIT